MAKQTAKTQIRETSMSATIIRADGTREPLGKVAYWHRNPLRRWAFAVGQRLKRR